jgi:hypothetical protein
MLNFDEMRAKLVQAQNLIASAQDGNRDGGMPAVDKARALVDEVQVLRWEAGESEQAPFAKTLTQSATALKDYGAPALRTGGREPYPEDIDARALAQAQEALRRAIGICDGSAVYQQTMDAC